MDREAARLHRLVGELVDRAGVPRDDVRVARAPLRVCPLGAHIDHQLGKVTGLALDHSVLLTFVPRRDGRVRLWSLEFDGLVAFDLESIGPPQEGDWGNYPRGAARVLREAHGIRHGLDGILSGSLPIGGLSSSAAVDVAYLLALESANELELETTEQIRLAQRIENGYIGLNNGILDQSMILASRRRALTVLDCLKVGFEHIPLPPEAQFDVVVAYSGLSRALTGTDYNRRVAECELAARLLLERAGVALPAQPRLRHVPAEVLVGLGPELPAPLDRRARHYVGEMQRVEAGIAAWEQGDIAEVGRLMTASGDSSIVNYQCGGPHLTSLYKVLIGVPGVHGARFSGAGFKGSCVALADRGARQGVRAAVAEQYAATHPDVAETWSVHFCESADAAELL